MKNVLKLWRNWGGVVFQLVLPILQITLFNFALGGTPHDLDIFVVNDEVFNCTGQIHECNGIGASCALINALFRNGSLLPTDKKFSVLCI